MDEQDEQLDLGDLASEPEEPVETQEGEEGDPSSGKERKETPPPKEEDTDEIVDPSAHSSEERSVETHLGEEYSVRNEIADYIDHLRSQVESKEKEIDRLNTQVQRLNKSSSIGNR